MCLVQSLEVTVGNRKSVPHIHQALGTFTVEFRSVGRTCSERSNTFQCL
jgi:hypothetical protein